MSDCQIALSFPISGTSPKSLSAMLVLLYRLAIGLQDIYTNNALRDVCTESPEAER